jgi:hypothetical protein
MITLGVRLDPRIAMHFLLRNTVVSGTVTHNGVVSDAGLFTGGAGFGVVYDETKPGWLDLNIQVRYHYGGNGFVLLKILQGFSISGTAGAPPLPQRWQKGAGVFTAGIPTSSPRLHPLLRMTGTDITVALDFLDITELYERIHGRTPWFQVLNLIRRTNFRLRFLAHLRGEPSIWYAVVPEQARLAAQLTPHLFYWPADYGGIKYDHRSEAGITTPNHNTSVGSNQCSGETLCSFLATPLTHDEYLNLLPAYTTLRASWPTPVALDERHPWPLHRYRDLLSVGHSLGKIVPRHWSLPFGFEQVFARTDHLLFFIQGNGGSAPGAIGTGLKRLAESAIATIYSGGDTLVNADYAAGKLVISCYSESGGNAFTACRNNVDDIRALICIEPQYMNEHLKGEHSHLALGFRVIPMLLKQKIRVVLIARRWEPKHQLKYLPKGVTPARLDLLPTEANRHVIDYPPTTGNRHNKHRLGRLLDHTHDATSRAVIADGGATIDPGAVNQEIRTDAALDALRQAGKTDREILDEVFVDKLNLDKRGGFYSHNFLLAGGEREDAYEPSGALKPNTRYTTFFGQAMELVR